MNIIYISNLTGNKFAGPNYSVPKQIYAQSKYDNIFWINLNDNLISQDKNNLCNMISKIGRKIPEDLPYPFSNPDLVIFEEFYCFCFNKVVKQIIKKNVPYIIIPRSQLTKCAKETKKVKKKIADYLFLNKFIKKAIAIQYLTSDEKNESVCANKVPSFIIPNGIDIVQEKNFFPNNMSKFIITYIGRLERYQKGLDLLVESCRKVASQMREQHIELHLYGNDQDNTKQFLMDFCKKYKMTDIFFVHNAVYNHEKEKVLLNSSCFIMTSRFEGLPMGLIEALAYGLPCIVTTGTYMTKQIEEYDAGWTCKTDIESIANVLENVIYGKDTLKIKRNNAINLSKQYDWNEIAIYSHKCYKEILETRRKKKDD